MRAFSKLKKFLEEKNSFLLVCHEKIDGDAVGSLLAFGAILKELKKNFSMVSKDQIPEVFSFLPGVLEIKNDFILDEFDAVILLDNGEFKRTGYSDQLSGCKTKNIPIANIDHHSKNDIWKLATLNYVNPDASSTCELLYEFSNKMKINLTPDLSTCLLLGLYTDTGGFQHQNTTEKVFTIFSELLRRGARLKKISEYISGQKNISLLKLWGIALNRLRLNPELGISFSLLTKKDITKSGGSEEDVSGLVNLLNTIPESRLSLLLYETQNGNIKGSLRTEEDRVDVAALAKLLGGGGHKKAAGFMFRGKITGNDGNWKII